MTDVLLRRLALAAIAVCVVSFATMTLLFVQFQQPDASSQSSDFDFETKTKPDLFVKTPTQPQHSASLAGGWDIDPTVIDDANTYLLNGGVVAPNADLVQDPTVIVIDVEELPKRRDLTPEPATCELALTDPGGVPQVLVAERFDGETDDWVPLAGTWERTDQGYSQSATDGFDHISQLLRDLPAAYRIAVDFTFDDATAAGVVLGQPIPNSRDGATVVDIVPGGTFGHFVRWGRYDLDSGRYAYDGGADLPASFDPAAMHNLTVEVRAEQTIVIVDGRVTAMFGPTPRGRAGLVTSRGAVMFTSVTVESL